MKNDSDNLLINEIERLKGPEIVFENVTKEYPNGVRALDDVSFRVAPGGFAFLMGESGAGKSSLTRKLLERGYHIMADDVAAVEFDGEKDMVFSAFPYQKLCRNEIDKRKLDNNELIYINEDKDKFLVPVGNLFVSDPQPLKLLVFLTVGDVKEVSIRKLTGFEQFLGFNNSLFLNALKGPWENSPEIINLALKLASKCHVYQIVRPVDGDSQDRMADEIEKIIREL